MQENCIHQTMRNYITLFPEMNFRNFPCYLGIEISYLISRDVFIAYEDILTELVNIFQI